jgi:hypothetical protein
VLGGCIILCVSISSIFLGRWYGHNEFWVMMKYGVESSWTQLCSIFDCEMPWEFNYCKPLLIYEDGNMLLVEINFNNLILVWHHKEEWQ